MAFPPPSHFDAAWYLAAYPDVAASGRDPLRHYRRHGWREGRLPAFMPAVWRERDLRWGMLEDGPATLEAMALHEAAGPNRSRAAIACARDAARRDDWQAAQGWLAPLDPDRDLIGLTGDPDPLLLAIETAVVTGHLPHAERLLNLGRKAFGPLPDLILSAANIVAARHGHGRAWQQSLAPLFARARLCGIEVTPGPDPVFDRLAPQRAPRPCGRYGPLVSVIMPARDAARTIGTALDSLTAQSWQSLDIVVVDNGSADATADIARARAGSDPRIRLLDGRAEPGTYAARNLGVAAAHGAFITVLDADDWAHPSRIARQVRSLRFHRRAVASIADWVRVTPELRFTRWWQDQGHIHPDMSSLMIRAEVRERLGFWDRARVGADTEYHDRIIAACGIHGIRRTAAGIPLGFGRLRRGSLTQARETRIDSQVFGPRRSYVQTARRWHADALAKGGLPLPRLPDHRPFALPAALAITPPDPPPPSPRPGPDEAGLYDDDWYMRSYPDLRAMDADGLAHYLSHGAAEGRDPGPAFSTSGYAMRHGIAPETAVAHYLDHGRAAGWSPLPVFDGALPAPAEGQHVLVFGHAAGHEIFGAERCLLTTLDRAAEAGRTPSVVLPRLLNQEYRDALLARCHRLHVLPFGWRFGGVAPDPRTHDRLVRLIHESGATEVHQNTSVLDAPLRAARAAGVPSVAHVHELPASDPRLCADLGQSADELRHALLREADRFVVPSPPVRDWLRAPSKRVLIMPNRIDPALADLPVAPRTPPRIALIGSLSARKGLHDTISVARILARNRTPASVVLVGPASADLGRVGSLPDNTTHLGYAPSPVDALAEADIVLSLSNVAESFGLTVLEALVAGRPVICYDRGAPPDLVGRDGMGGIVVPADQPGAVAAALTPWLTDPGALDRAAGQARTRGLALARTLRSSEPAGLFHPGHRPAGQA